VGALLAEARSHLDAAVWICSSHDDELMVGRSDRFSSALGSSYMNIK